MSFECMAWAIKQKTGSIYNKAVLMHLANCTNHLTGMCRPRIKVIAEEAEMSERSVQNALKDLSEKGFLQVVPRIKDGHQLANDYRIVSDPIGTPFAPGAGRAPGGDGGAHGAPTGAGGAPGGFPGAPGGVHLVHPVKQEGLNQEENQEGTPSLSPGLAKGEQVFIDEWNAAAKVSGLAEIREWTSKRSKKLKALAAVYKTSMGESMKLAIQECHKNAWCISQRSNVDHLLVADNFQRYLDAARTPVAAVQPGQTSASTVGGAGGREEPAWAKEKRLKAEGHRREIDALRRKRARCVSERGENTLDVAEIDNAIEVLKTKILGLGHEP